MTSKTFRSFLFTALLTVAFACGGDDDSPTPDSGTDSAVPDDGGPVERCGLADDPDEDFISSMDEGDGDLDGDGIPNSEDDDSDGDMIPDAVEAGDMSCTSDPIDTDMDGTPDFLDRDSNGDTVPDANQRVVPETNDPADQDGDGELDYRDLDVDGDGIPNAEELSETGELVDTDMDGTPDVFDIDSDGDTISDADEGRLDADEDGIQNFRDLDSDDDGLTDNMEAGDGDVNTAPNSCANEVDPVTGEVRPDGRPDFIDFDSDNDGASDADEIRYGTDLCDTDSDDDGFPDVVEIAVEQVNCPDGGDGPQCGCALNDDCGVPADDFFFVLPFNGDPQTAVLDFSTEIRSAGIFFLTDITGSMSGTLSNVQDTVSQPGTGLITQINETIPDAWFGGGAFQDFPFGGYGSRGTDEPFRLAIQMTPPAGADRVATAFRGLSAAGGSDGPESHVEALYQTMTGEGADWTYMGGASSYSLRAYEGDCLDGGWGAPCFREGSLPIIVLFTDICAHNGPPGESTSSCSNYTGIDPAPQEWSGAISAMNARGAKFVGINASRSGSCAGMVGPSGSNPCFFLKRTAEETGSVDLDGNPLVYDLSNETSADVFAEQVVTAIETVATRVPIDVDTALRDDESDDVDARQFIKRRQPACLADPPITPCWGAPDDIAHEDAVAAIDSSTFFSALPGTSVRFHITFQNTTYEGDRVSRIFIAFIQVRGSGAAVLDERQVYIIVPARSGGPII